MIAAVSWLALGFALGLLVRDRLIEAGIMPHVWKSLCHALEHENHKLREELSEAKKPRPWDGGTV